MADLLYGPFSDPTVVLPDSGTLTSRVAVKEAGEGSLTSVDAAVGFSAEIGVLVDGVTAGTGRGGGQLPDKMGSKAACSAQLRM